MVRNKNGFNWNEIWKKDGENETTRKRKIDQFEKWEIDQLTEQKRSHEGDRKNENRWIQIEINMVHTEENPSAKQKWNNLEDDESGL